MRARQIAEKSDPMGYDGRYRDLDPAPKLPLALPLAKVLPIRMKSPPDGTFEYADRLRKGHSASNGQSWTIRCWSKPMAGRLTTWLRSSMTTRWASRVIRAEEWLNSLPKHVWLGERLGFAIPNTSTSVCYAMPTSKISKRKNPTSLTWYRKNGYLPEALLNFRSLGHGHPDELDYFDLPEMTRIFELDRLNVTGPVFDFARLDDIKVISSVTSTTSA